MNGENCDQRIENGEAQRGSRATEWLISHLLEGLNRVATDDVITDPAWGSAGAVMLDSDTYEFDGAPSGTSSLAREGTYAVADAMSREFKDDAASGKYSYRSIGKLMAFDTDLILRRVEETAAKLRGS